VLIDLERNTSTEVIKVFVHALKYNKKPSIEEIIFFVWKKYKKSNYWKKWTEFCSSK